MFIKLRIVLFAASKTSRSGLVFSLSFLIAKPNIIANTTIATIFPLESNPLKSPTLISSTVLSKKLSSGFWTFSVEKASLIIPVSLSLISLNVFVVAIAKKTAINEVINEITMILPKIFLSLFGESILAIVVLIVKNKSGTIVTNNRFKNKSPSGLTTLTSSLNIIPHIAPIIKDKTSRTVTL